MAVAALAAGALGPAPAVFSDWRGPPTDRVHACIGYCTAKEECLSSSDLAYLTRADIPGKTEMEQAFVGCHSYCEAICAPLQETVQKGQQAPPER